MASSRPDREEGTHVVSFLERAERRRADRASRNSALAAHEVAHEHSLPLQPGTLLGRQAELETIHQHLSRADVPLLTLTGPGGVGKSRLAVEAAQREEHAFADGVWFVDMASLDEPTGVLEHVADMFHMRRKGKRPLLVRLKERVGRRAMLLVLDGCDGVTTRCAPLADLVAACQSLKVLVTSREPLHLLCEHIMPVRPLALPDLGALPALNDLAQSSSIALFVQRARAMRLDFRLTEENAHDVAEICVRLEGLPLAIGLAAAQINILPPSAILQRLERDSLVLKDRVQDVPERQRSLTESIDFSYQQLDERYQAFLRRVSVFVGGFSIDGANEVAAPDATGIEVLSEISALVDKSLVVAVATDDVEPRFVLSDALRNYGWKQLSRHQEQDDVCDRHTAFYVALIERAALEIRGNERDDWLMCLEREAENLLAAVSWARKRGEAEAEMRLVCGLAECWLECGQIGQGIQGLQRALGRYAARDSLRAKALNELGVLLRLAGQYEQAEMAHEEALRLGRELDEAPIVCLALMELGAAFLAAGHADAARVRLDEALMAYERLDDPWGVAQTLLSFAQLALAEGHVVQGEAHATESLTVFQSLGDRRDAADALTVLARVTARRNRAAAGQLLTDSLNAIQRLKETRLVCTALEEAAWLTSAGEHAEVAARLLAGADAMRALTGFARPAHEREICEVTWQELRSRLDRGSLERASMRGRELSQEQLFETALSALSRSAASANKEPVKDRGGNRDLLSKREHEVLDLIAEGRSNKAIAAALGISENTAKFHVTSILNKLGADSRAQIVAMAAQRRLLHR